MLNEEKRARDVDRERAVAFVEDAWIDGQLGVDEYRERMDRLLSAVTLGDLSAEVRDLQGRNGVDWSPEPAPVTAVSSDVAADRSAEIAVPAPVLAPVSASVPTSKVDDGEVMIGVTIGVIVLIGALVLWADNDEDGARDDAVEEFSDVPALSSTSLFTATEFEALVGSAEADLGTTTVTELAVSDTSAAGLFLIDDAHYESVYDAESRTWSTPAAVPEEESSFARVFELTDVDADVLTSRVEEGVWRGVSYDDVAVTFGDDDASGNECYRVEASDAGGQTTASYTCEGDLLG